MQISNLQIERNIENNKMIDLSDLSKVINHSRDDAPTLYGFSHFNDPTLQIEGCTGTGVHILCATNNVDTTEVLCTTNTTNIIERTNNKNLFAQLMTGLTFNNCMY